MLKTLVEMGKSIVDIGTSYKVSLLTASSPFVVWFLEALSWLDENKANFGIWASLLLTIILIVTHFCKLIWSNRREREDSRKRELELEQSRLQIDLLKIQLKEKQEENKEEE